MIDYILGLLLLLASVGVITTKKPVHSCLYFLFSLFMLASIYLQLSAEFIAVMQVLVYAGAILVIFMFVMMLFQDAHHKIAEIQAKSFFPFIIFSSVSLIFFFLFFIYRIEVTASFAASLAKGFGTVESLGEKLYVDFFFPFEAVILLFLVALVGALYMGRKGEIDG